MWIQPARGNIYLVTGSIHIIDKHARNFGKQLTRCLLGDVSIDILNINNFILLSGPDSG